MTLRLYLDEDSSDLDLMKAGEQTHRLLRLINRVTAEDMENRLEFLSGRRAS